MKIDFSPPHITDRDVEAVTAVLNGKWITTGPVTKSFEAALAQWAGLEHDKEPESKKKHVACLNSATAALECALRLLGVGVGDEVIVPAYTFTATASVVCHVGAKPVMVDSQTDSFEMDYEQLAAAITPNTKVVIPVDLGGVMCAYDTLFAVLEGKKMLFSPAAHSFQGAFDRVIVLADAAHSLGAVRCGVPSGAAADFTAFSFHAVKNVTSAEGGALVWKQRQNLDDAAIYERLMQMSLHGQNKSALDKSKNSKGSWIYDIIDTDYKYNMTDVAAALGKAQLERYPQMLERRRALVKQYEDGLDAEKVEIWPHFSPDSSSSCHLFMLRLRGRTEAFRNRFIEEMANREITCNVHYKPLPLLTAYRTRGFSIDKYPHALMRYQNEVTLPLYSMLTDEQVTYILESFEQSYAACEAAGV
jgi:dTDP-4-amino-4,6-dideoxygalactose transaminase